MSTENEFSLEGAKVLEILHSSNRFGSSNEFLLPASNEEIAAGDFGSSFSEFRESEAGDYYQGIIAPSIALAIFYGIWLILLPFARCYICKCSCCSNNVKLMFFLLFISASILGWFLSISGINRLQDGVLDLVSDADEFTEDVDTFASLIQQVIDQSDTLTEVIEDLNDACPDEITDLIDIDGSILDVFQPVQEQVADIGTSSADLESDVEPFLDTIAQIYTIVTTCVIIFLFIFGFTTTFSVFYNRNMFEGSHKNCFAQLNSCINCCGCLILFTLGLLFATSIIVFCMLLAPIATVGSDLCIPDPNENVLAALADGEGNSSLDFCLLDGDFDDLSEVEQLGNIICHYSQCRGDNKILELGTIDVETLDDDSLNITIELIEEAKDLIDDAREVIDEAVAGGALDDDEAELCNDGLDGVDDLLLVFESLIEAGIELFTCNELTPLYASIFNDDLCNGVVAGMGVIYITWTLGATGLMLAMYMYLTIDDETKEKEEKYIMEEPGRASARVSQPQDTKEEVLVAEPVRARTLSEDEQQTKTAGIVF